jgi:hypothetical protein
MNNAWPVHFGVPAPPPAPPADSAFEVVVVFTDVSETLVALGSAARLAHGLGARIRLVAPQIVPFPAPLEQPPVDPRFAERKFRVIAEQSQVDMMVDIRLCRDWEAGVLHSVKPGSIVVLGAAKSWWRSRKQRRLARTLRHRGHQVILSESE